MDIAKHAAEIAEAQSKYDDYLMSLPNVVGTGIGYRQRSSQLTKELCLVVMVSRKLPQEDLPAGAMLPRQLDGLPIDVVETGKFVI